MNKDKIIKDLKEKNHKLKNQYELQEVRLYSSQHKVDELKEDNKKLNNIINELEKYIHNELILDFYNDKMPCELIINKMENMIKKLKGSEE
jgi:hypothetical protein